jgi:hypothetical protein
LESTDATAPDFYSQVRVRVKVRVRVRILTTSSTAIRCLLSFFINITVTLTLSLTLTLLKYSSGFYTKRVQGYARDVSELTLHQLLRKLMKLLEQKLLENAEKLTAIVDVTLLKHPTDIRTKKFYPQDLTAFPEYREYFSKKEEKLRKQKLSHMFHGSTRSDDAVDSLFRGGANNGELMYYPDPKACTSIHSQVGWRSNLSTNDVLAG